MKTDLPLLQALVAFAALFAGFYGVVTRPLLKMLDDQRSQLLQFRTEVLTELREMRKDLTTQSERLGRVEERLARVEERLPPPLVRR